MMKPIQTIPMGLLSLLQLKQQGQNPDTLSEVVNPVVDLLQFWLQYQSIDITTALFGGQVSRTVPTAGTGIYGYNAPGPATVPPNQLWWIEHYTVEANLLAAEYIRLAPMITAPSVGLQAQQIGTDVNDAVTARARSVSAHAHNFWVRGGAGLGFQVFDSLTAANITVTGAIKGVILTF